MTNKTETQIQITAEYGRKLNVTEAQMSEWLDDLPEEIDEIMAQPLGGETFPDGSRGSFSPFAFCAPEMIRGAVASHILKTNLASAGVWQ